ncbi:MAG: hypothetical protein NC116_09550 [Clostridium sp.]|nr:hypothetical protein [Clostridium sp.]
MKSKTLFATLAVASLTLVSCETVLTEEMTIDLNLSVSEATSPEFETFVEDGCTGTATRTALSNTTNCNGNYYLTWEKDDAISITDGTSSAIYKTAECGSNVKFEKESGRISNTATIYKAFYPSYLTTQNMELPVIQEYVENGVKDFPMYAESCCTTLQFKNLCGILRVSLKNLDTNNQTKIKNITVMADGKGLSGKFTIGEYGAAVTCGTGTATLTCTSPVALNSCSATDFNIILPKEEYCGMRLKITTEDGKVINMKAQGVINIRRSGITKVNIALKPATFNGGLEDITITESDVEFNER